MRVRAWIERQKCSASSLKVASAPPAYPPAGIHERALDLLFPPTCVGCQRLGRWICTRCWAETPWLLEQKCVGCGRLWLSATCNECDGATSNLTATVASARFEGTAREAVHALKYTGHHAIHGLMGRVMATTLRNAAFDAVVAVPLHPRRRRERGYDQAHMLSAVVAKSRDTPLRKHCLVRTRYTTQQVLLDGDVRRSNVLGAFATGEELAGENILLVDDVTTTGATMQAAAAALLEGGAGSVVGLAFASAW